MTEQAQTSNQNELDLTDLKYYTEIISRLDAEIRDSVYSITSKDMKEIARYGKVARTLEKITNVYPAMDNLLIDFKEHIDELPDFVEVANHEL
ncbi:hypothetical protein [uncultured Weissella sp.]|uniref:hypothetical protein n=1 Tax=uncultured Weissella sp. TaxID=253243 RepID=UPI00258673D1|nr:hypothetical protein [uncultured Weissella sp.]